MRLYDLYSEELFEAALATGEPVETAAKATQTAFLRILRRPPALDAPDSEVASRLRRLVPGGPIDPAPPGNGNGNGHARAIDVGWLRSETVAMAGARFDDDWSGHLWTPPPADEEPPPDEAVDASAIRRRFARVRLALPAVVAVTGLTMLGGMLGTLLVAGGNGHSPIAPASAQRERPARPPTAKQSDAGHRDRSKRGTKPRLLAMKPRSEQDGSAAGHRNCHSKKASDPC